MRRALWLENGFVAIKSRRYSGWRWSKNEEEEEEKTNIIISARAHRSTGNTYENKRFGQNLKTITAVFGIFNPLYKIFVIAYPSCNNGIRDWRDQGGFAEWIECLERGNIWEWVERGDERADNNPTLGSKSTVTAYEPRFWIRHPFLPRSPPSVHFPRSYRISCGYYAEQVA